MNVTLRGVGAARTKPRPSRSVAGPITGTASEPTPIHCGDWWGASSTNGARDVANLNLRTACRSGLRSCEPVGGLKSEFIALVIDSACR
jgi:hypothetical protein